MDRPPSAVPEASATNAPTGEFPAAPAPGAPPSSSASPPSPVSSAAWRNALVGWLQAHKAYPDAARRDALQGRVVVRFVLDGRGHLEEVSLVQSSGFPVLDEAALALLRGAHLPPPPASAAAGVSITLPIRYSLSP